MSVSLIAAFGLTQAAASGGTGLTDFASYTSDVAPSDWTIAWNSADTTYVVRDAANDTDSTDFVAYTTGVQPSDWSSAWNTTNTTYTVVEA